MTETAARIDDDELARLALSAEAHDPFADDVAPFDDPADDAGPALLPEWYMPAPSARLGRGRRLGLVGIAIGMMMINIGGFCTTYGFPEFVWN